MWTVVWTSHRLVSVRRCQDASQRPRNVTSGLPRHMDVSFIAGMLRPNAAFTPQPMACAVDSRVISMTSSNEFVHCCTTNRIYNNTLFWVLLLWNLMHHIPLVHINKWVSLHTSYHTHCEVDHYISVTLFMDKTVFKSLWNTIIKTLKNADYKWLFSILLNSKPCSCVQVRPVYLLFLDRCSSLTLRRFFFFFFKRGDGAWEIGGISRASNKRWGAAFSGGRGLLW